MFKLCKNKVVAMQTIADGQTDKQVVAYNSYLCGT